MKKNTSRSLSRYLFPPIDNILKGLLILVAGIAVTILENSLWVMAVFAVLALMEAVSDISKISRFISQIKYIRSGKEYDDILEDYDNSTEYLDGKVKAGTRYIFGKKCGSVIEYSGIRFAHCITRKNYGYANNLFVEIITTDGSRHKLCKLHANDKTAALANSFMKELKARSPEADIVIK